jgi:magnesium-transporting ATPase (P-type)
VAFNTVLGTVQEYRAERSAASLQRLIASSARVTRDGAERNIDAAELVVGDIVRLESGQRVPADMRLVQTIALSIDESFLTGESEAATKDTSPCPASAPISERRNIAFAGSTVLAGRGVGLVFGTGPRTQVGRIADVVLGAEGRKPPLVLRLERFARQISAVVLAACVLLAVVGALRGMPWLEVFLLAVALAVSAIPEGLPVAVTVALSIATSRMARRGVIVRRLSAVEGLGSCTYIASDKTGTLTVNQQTLRQVVLADDRAFTVAGSGYNDTGHVTDDRGVRVLASETPALARLARCTVLCNEATLHRNDDGTWHHAGDAVDVALLAFARKLALDPDAIRRSTPIVAEIPFESHLAFAAAFFREGETMRVAVKGSPEALLPRCTATAIDSAAVHDAANRLTAHGLRVLAVAEGVVAVSSNGRAPAPNAPSANELPELTLLGLVALIDPPRAEAAAAIARCREAGITVSMITGDHPHTAHAIAATLGITSGDHAVVTGAQLDSAAAVGTPAVQSLVERGRVFARVSPLQKLTIVETLRALGHVVAVTGDGVNDAPALKRADIGVAMGSGSDVTKDTASLIVSDDNFATIEAGVQEGRFAYDNIRKVTLLVVSSGAAEVLLLLLSLMSGLPLPLLAVQLLWLNLVTNGIQDIALAFEAGEPETMRKPPRPPSEGIFNRRMIEQTLLGGVAMGGIAFAVWALLIASGVDEQSARNELLLLFVLMQNVHVMNCRSERTSVFRIPLSRNRVLVIGVLAAQGVHLLAMHLPFLQGILQVSPVSLPEWGLAVGTAAAIVVVMESYKVLRPGREK